MSTEQLFSEAVRGKETLHGLKLNLCPPKINKIREIAAVKCSNVC